MTTQTTTQTHAQQTIDILTTFLALPSTDLPSAHLLDDEGDAWTLIRAYARGDRDRCAAYLGASIRLHASTTPFDRGVTITLR